MTAAPRALARPVLNIYWLTLVGGLALFVMTRSDDTATTAALVIGALGGTLLGHALALRNLRFWLAALIITAAAIYAGPLVPDGVAATRLWQAFVPAALCAFWSLGDRSGLVAAWFPAVIWMLTILDRTGLSLAPDGTAAILLAGLAALFVAFLHARESRRVGLWRSVAADPIAPARDIELLRQPPARHLARAAWFLSVGAITAAIMVWLVPPLWQREALGGPTVQIADPTFVGLHCCPAHRDADTESARIKEYLGLGLGHDEHATRPREQIACRACDGPPRDTLGVVAATGRGAPLDGWVSHADGAGGAAVAAVADDGDRAAAVDSRVRAATGGRWAGSYWPGPANSSGDPSGTTGAMPAPRASLASSPNAASPNAASPNAASPNAASPNAASPNAASPTPNPAPPTPNAAEPTPNPAPPTPNAAPPTPSPTPSTAPPRPSPTTSPSPTTATPTPTPSPTIVPPTPIASGAAPPAAETAESPRVAATGSPMVPQRGLADAAGPSLLGWLALAMVAAAVLQLVRLALRPVRRLVTLRHLRRPFWDETVDQRVSNAWQLALIGLRDAGWRSGAAEAPRELARRVAVDGVDRCAAILERARHGVGLDAGDLADMQLSADAAYRAARRDLGSAARALGWLRWPLT